jgi:hypothetical protein
LLIAASLSARRYGHRRDEAAYQDFEEPAGAANTSGYMDVHPEADDGAADDDKGYMQVRGNSEA